MSKSSDQNRRHMTVRAAAESVVRHLHEQGHVAYFAGGCVRDMLMGHRPNDYDVATSAPPKEVVKLFRSTRQVGAKFGVVLVRIDGQMIEVATFRRDLDYRDGRRPTAVEFTDASEDAIRRDFTINGMFYDPLTREVVDYVGGQMDLRSRIVRAIGDPQKRFAEDHLRLLRAVRFAARFGFRIEATTWSAMCTQADQITGISPERIHEELATILTHPSRARAFADLCECGVFGHLWPTASIILSHRRLIEKHLAALPAKASFELALAVVMEPLAKESLADACESLRCSNETKKTVAWLHANRLKLDDPDRLALADLKLLMAHEAFVDLLILFASRLKAQRRPPTAYRKITARVRCIRPADVTPPPLITGHDLTELGLSKGPAYKRILNRLYYLQLNGVLSDRHHALAQARQLVREAHS